MKRLLFGIVIVVGLVVAAIFGAAFLVPPEDVKTEIVRQVRKNTGWNLRIDGAIDIGVWPDINLAASDVGLSGRAWADGLEFVSADNVSFGLAILPLLTGNVEVATVRFDNPVFELEIDRYGQTSWDPVDTIEPGTKVTSIEDAIGQASDGGNRPGAPADDGTSPASQNRETGSGSSLPIQNLKVSSIKVVNGTLSYLDRRTGDGHTIEKVDITASVPSLDSRSRIEGSLVWRDQPVTVKASIEQLRAVFENTVSEIAADVGTQNGNIAVEGRVSVGGGLTFDGKVAASLPSLPGLLAWATGSADGVPEVGPISLATPLKLSPDGVSADPLSLVIGEAKGSGSVDLRLNGDRPKLTSRFAFGRIDLDAFVKSDAGDKLVPRQEFGGARIIPASLDRPIVLAQVGIPRPNPRRTSPGPTQENEVKKTPPANQSDNGATPAVQPGADTLDLSVLGTLDADLDITIGEIVSSGITARDIALTAKLDAGRLVANLEEADIFGGKTAGNLVFDSALPVPDMTGALKAASLNLASLARLGGHSDPVAGALSIDATFQTRGRSVAEFVGALDARGSLRIRDASFAGLPLAEPLNDPNAARIDNLEAIVRFDGRAAPIIAEGSAGWRGETFRLNANLTPAPLALGRAAPLSASLESGMVTLGYDGSVSPAGGADGAVSIATPSLRNLLVWLNQEAPDIGGLGPFSFKGRLAAAPGSVAFSNAVVRLDDSSGNGSGRIDTSGATPSLQATLSFDSLNLTPYLAPGQGGARPVPQKSGTGQSQDQATIPSATPAAGSAATPAGRTATPAGQWSQTPIDFSGLKTANARLTLSANEIIAEKIRVGPATVAVSLQGGVLSANLTRLALYQGSGEARFILDGSGQTPAITANASLNGINAFPLLRDAADFKYLEGTGDLSFDISASGASEFAMVRSLNGVAGFLFRDGAIRGINIPKMVRNVSSNVLSGWQNTPTEKTDFSSLSASFNIINGVATNDDLNMVGPLVQVTGAGTTSVPPRTLAWRVDPKVVGTLLGQGRGDEFAGVGVPIIIKGSWSAPKIYPDITGILQNPSAAYEQLRGLGGGIFKQIDPLKGESAEAAQDKVKQRIEKQTGINVDNVVKDGKIDKDKAVDEAVKGIISIFGNRN